MTLAIAEPHALAVTDISPVERDPSAAYLTRLTPLRVVSSGTPDAIAPTYP